MIGGQALIEGIMMLGPEKVVVVRKPDGTREEQVEERVLIKDKHPAPGAALPSGRVQFLLFAGQWGQSPDVLRFLLLGGVTSRRQ